MKKFYKFITVSVGSALLFSTMFVTFVYADSKVGISAESGNAELAAFDIVHAKITASDNWLTFHMHVSGKAGETTPTPTGKLEGSDVFSYVWPTKLDSAIVGFDKEQGILSMAITSHPDFDDTPLFDENGDGDLGNDGTVWHSHWVV
ncbi:MAG: hypothetical protein ACRBDX_06635, partial [Gammaproteobacteria bacterium]